MVTTDTHINDTYTGQWIQTLTASVNPDDHHNYPLTILEHGDQLQLITTDDQGIADDGVYLTQAYADRINIQVSDTITIWPGLTTASYNLPVAGIFTADTNQGIYLTKNYYESHGGHFNPNTLLADQETDLTSANDDGRIQAIIYRQDQIDNAQSFIDGLDSIFKLIIHFAILLVVIVLYNLGSLNFVERRHDYATIMVLGYRPIHLAMMSLLETLLTTLTGWLIGVPLGQWFLGQYLAQFSTPTMHYSSSISQQSYLIASLITWGTTILTALLMSLRLRTIDLVEALKETE